MSICLETARVLAVFCFWMVILMAMASATVAECRSHSNANFIPMYHYSIFFFLFGLGLKSFAAVLVQIVNRQTLQDQGVVPHQIDDLRSLLCLAIHTSLLSVLKVMLDCLFVVYITIRSVN